MLGWIVRRSLELRGLVLAAAVAVAACGIWAVLTAQLDVFPSFIPPTVFVQTEAPGLPVASVEQLVTVPIENILNGTSGLKDLRSTSISGLSVVQAVFQDGFDIYRGRQLIGERLAAEAARFPSGIKAPAVMPPEDVSAQILMIGLRSEALSPMALRTLAQWTVRPRLLAVPGVGSVTLYGGEQEQLQVVASPERLADHGLTLADVVRAAAGASAVGGAGFAELGGQRVPIEAASGLAPGTDLGQTPVGRSASGPVLLGQVARIGPGPAPKVGDAEIDGKPGILMIVSKQPGVNAIEVTRRVEEALSEVRSGFPPGVAVFPDLFRQADFIKESVANLKKAIGIGCLLVMGVLALFLFEWRTAFISVAAIPLSLLSAVIALRTLGMTLNTMTLGGLAIALGEVVDDAIIDVENIYRRLALNKLAPRPEPAERVTLAASLEVRSAVVYATFIVSLVFLPVFFMGGISGAIFSPIGFTYILAVSASLLVALTVTPVLCLLLLPSGAREESRAPLVRWLHRRYDGLLRGVLFHRAPVLAGAAALAAAAVCVLPFMGGEFLPDFREPDFVIHMVGLPGTSLAESLRVGRRVASALAAVPGVRSVVQQAGRAEMSEDTMGTYYSELWLALGAGSAEYPSVLRHVREVVKGVTGFRFSVKQFLKERLDEVISGAAAPIAVKIYGPDLEELRRLAQEAGRAMKGVRGVSDLAVQEQVPEPQLRVTVRRGEAALHGLTAADIVDSVRTAAFGKTVGQLYDGQQVVDIVVRAADDVRRDVDRLRRLIIAGSSGQRAPLESVADVRFAGAPAMIEREKASRRIVVSCGTEGRDVGGTMKDVQGAIAKEVRFPAGYHAEFSGEYQAARQGQRRILSLGALSLLGIFLLLYIDFKSFRLCLLMLLSVPFALIGGVVAAAAAGGSLSLGSLVGFVTLFGIAIRNGIMLISHYRHLQEEEGLPFGRELVLRGARERLSPILMTALSAGLALLPLVVGGGKPGHEIEHPMAVVIVGGLLSSTLLNLFVLPAAFERFGRPARREARGSGGEP